MINRANYLAIREHMEYRRRVLQNDEGTITVDWLAMKHLIIWADSIPLHDAPRKMPTFPEYLYTARNDGKDGREYPLTPKYMVKVLEHARSFFDWARKNKPEYRKVPESWIDTLKVRRSKGTQTKLTKRQVWTLEDVIKVVTFQTPNDTLRYQRDQAAIAFLFLSGMRVGAFVTLPISCVDMSQYPEKPARIAQLPEYYVQTKNSKAAVTFLLPIPELMSIVLKWDAKVREVAQGNMTSWYTKLDYSGLNINSEDYVTETRIVTGRRMALSQGMRELCAMAGVEYKSPHKLRHGHGVYGVKVAKTVAELKVISQNLMHSNIGITDGIYGKLAEDDMAAIIGSMTPDKLKHRENPFERLEGK